MCCEMQNCLSLDSATWKLSAQRGSFKDCCVQQQQQQKPNLNPGVSPCTHLKLAQAVPAPGQHALHRMVPSKEDLRLPKQYGACAGVAARRAAAAAGPRLPSCYSRPGTHQPRLLTWAGALSKESDLPRVKNYTKRGSSAKYVLAHEPEPRQVHNCALFSSPLQ